VKILAVDDNPSIRKMISTFFKLEGDEFQLETAENGAIALSKYETFKPDVVILDISMPVMDGIETLTRIMKIDRQAMVVMATASGSSEKIDECLRKGARGYVEKPFSPEDLLSTIRNLTKGGTSKTEITNLFSLAGNKMQSSMQKMFEGDISLKLKDIEVIPRTMDEQITYSHSGEAPRVASNVDQRPTIELPEGSIGFSTEVSGQQDGIIVAILKIKDLRSFSGQEDIGYMPEEEKANYMELFNVLNNNIVSQIIEFTHVKIELSPPRFYNKETDSMIKEHDFVKITYEISVVGNTVPLEYYMWFNVDHLIRS